MSGDSLSWHSSALSAVNDRDCDIGGRLELGKD